MPGGYGRGKRYRWWYHETGMPGWMRNRYDPRFDQRHGPGYDMIPPERMPPFQPTPFGHPPYFEGREPPLPPMDELKMLEEEEQIIEDELEGIKKRIEELRKEVK